MSWHCCFCGKVEYCDAYITIYDIKGMVPVNMRCHLNCFAKKLPKEELRNELLQLDKELKEREKRRCD